MAMLAVILLVGFFLLVVMTAVVRRVARLFFADRSAGAASRVNPTCICGYDLSRLDRARCPECGRVRFFDATPEELGLTDEELKRLAEVQAKRKSEGT